MHLAKKIGFVIVITISSCFLFSNSAIALTVIAISGSNTNIFWRKFGENTCPKIEERRVKVGTRLGKSQGLCIGAGAKKVTIECDKPPKQNGQNTPQDYPEGTSPSFMQVCPRDPSTILEP